MNNDPDGSDDDEDVRKGNIIIFSIFLNSECGADNL